LTQLLCIFSKQKILAEKSKFTLAGYSVGDARQLQQKDNSVDVVLLLGPLYHLIKEEDRYKALQELIEY
jgi:ubiquinone/menaquinone biosynthesis C-methylase UbiE